MTGTGCLIDCFAIKREIKTNKKEPSEGSEHVVFLAPFFYFLTTLLVDVEYAALRKDEGGFDIRQRDAKGNEGGTRRERAVLFLIAFELLSPFFTVKMNRMNNISY